MPKVDEALAAYFQDEASRRLASLGSDSLAARAHEVLVRQLASDDVSLEAVARALALTPRQLRSGLAAEETSLRALLDEVRRDTARVLVEAGRYSMTEIAFLLGLSETSAFSRAWRRWFGEAPRASAGSTRAAGAAGRVP
jgi:AraC-like DNA-binding protein